MTSYFVTSFRRQHVCGACAKSAPKKAAAGKKMCSTHLEIARLAFRLWSAIRREKGGCCECSKQAVPGKGRCRRHWLQNRRDCRAYRQANLSRERERNMTLQRFWLDQGKCLCSGHPKLPEGKRRCDDCRARNVARAHGQDCSGALAKLREIRAAARAARAAADRARLLELGYRFVGGDPAHGWCSKVVLA